MFAASQGQQLGAYPVRLSHIKLIQSQKVTRVLYPTTY